MAATTEMADALLCFCALFCVGLYVVWPGTQRWGPFLSCTPRGSTRELAVRNCTRCGFSPNSIMVRDIELGECDFAFASASFAQCLCHLQPPPALYILACKLKPEYLSFWIPYFGTRILHHKSIKGSRGDSIVRTSYAPSLRPKPRRPGLAWASKGFAIFLRPLKKDGFLKKAVYQNCLCT